MMNPYMDDTAGRRTVQLPLPPRELTAEVTGDFTLPDYQPEIKRLLRIGVNLLPPNRFAGGGGTDLTGSMDYYVLYVGQDGGVYCAPLSAEYRLETKGEADGGIPPVGEPMICLCDLSSDVPVGRVLAPRRLNIRCKVKARVGAYGECPLEAGAVEGDPTVETLTAEAAVGRLYWGMGEVLPLQDDVILSPADGNMRVVCAEGQVMVTEAAPSMGAVNCRGEVMVKLTLAPAESVAEFAIETATPRAASEWTVLRRKIPFSQAVETEGVTPACTATACGYCSEISVEMEDGQLHMDVGVICEARAQSNETVTYVKDLYSTRRESTCRYAVYPAEQALRAVNGNFTLSDSLPLSEAGIDPTARVVDITATAVPEGLTADPAKGRCVLTGSTPSPSPSFPSVTSSTIPASCGRRSLWKRRTTPALPGSKARCVWSIAVPAWTGSGWVLTPNWQYRCAPAVPRPSPRWWRLCPGRRSPATAGSMSSASLPRRIRSGRWLSDITRPWRL